jgi:hypothetical protein
MNFHFKKSAMDYFPEFFEAMKQEIRQFESVEDWKLDPLSGQEGRAMDVFNTDYQNHLETGAPVPWMRWAVICLVAWVREFAFAELIKEKSKRAVDPNIDRMMGKPLQPLIRGLAGLKKQIGKGK